MPEFQVLPRIQSGAGRVKELKSILDGLGSHRPLIVTDRGIVESGVLARAIGTDISRHAVTYDQVKADPAIEQVIEAAEMARQADVDCVIGIGGGSSIDCAKAILVRLATTEPMRDLAGPISLQGRLGEALPFIAIPTTAGTGSEATRVAVITDAETRRKLGFISDRLLPRVAILDPDLLAAMPARIAAWSGLDALTHAIEAFIGKRASVYSDAMARQAIALIGANLESFVADRSNTAAAAAMLDAACMAGIAFNNASVGLVHAIAHPVGTYYHVPHGLACGIFLPGVVRFNEAAGRERLGEVLALLSPGKQTQISLADVLLDLSERIGMPRRLSQVAYAVEATDELIAEVVAQPFHGNSPRTASPEDIRQLIAEVA